LFIPFFFSPESFAASQLMQKRICLLGSKCLIFLRIADSLSIDEFLQLFLCFQSIIQISFSALVATKADTNSSSG
jgi:hypothetical protein